MQFVDDRNIVRTGRFALPAVGADRKNPFVDRKLIVRRECEFMLIFPIVTMIHFKSEDIADADSGWASSLADV